MRNIGYWLMKGNIPGLILFLLFTLIGRQGAIAQEISPQEIVFKNSLDSVQLSWEKETETISGNKSIKIKRLKRPIQFTAEKKGYKPEYFGLINNRDDLYKKEVEVNFKRKIPYYTKGQKHIYLEDFKVPETSIESEQISGEFEEFGISEKKPGNIDYLKYGMSRPNEFKSGKKLNEYLIELGYADTSGKILLSNVSETSLEATIKKSKFYISAIKKGAYSDYRIVCELTIEWKFYDEYKQVKLTEELTTKSGQFVPIYTKNGILERPSEVSERAAYDALINSFIDLVNNEKAGAWISGGGKPNMEVDLEPLKLKRPASPVALKTAIKSTFPVITNKGFGSGFVISPDGYFLTNYHVIAGQDSSIKILISENDSLTASIVRVSEFADLALLKCDRNFEMAILMDPTLEVSLADEVYAIGTPLSIELGQTVSKGIVSGMRKNDINIKIIQTDVSVNPGNSGGPLLSSDGKLIGVVSAKIAGKGIEGLGFGISIDDAMKALKIGY